VDSLPSIESDLREALSANVFRMLEAVGVAAYVTDEHRRVRWQNAASLELVGDLRGRLDASLLGPEDLAKARAAFEQKQNGASHTELEVLVAGRDGRRLRVAVSSVPLRNADGAMIGSFGLAQVLEELEPSSPSAPLLSRRERETLTLLAAGHSTAQMAQEMGISKETVRNHVKGLLRSLGASSRVEAIAKARSLGLI
jgi:DNA-binding CsgD family transcriptional regulator